jgi:hypothetical protein
MLQKADLFHSESARQASRDTGRVNVQNPDTALAQAVPEPKPFRIRSSLGPPRDHHSTLHCVNSSRAACVTNASLSRVVPADTPMSKIEWDQSLHRRPVDLPRITTNCKGSVRQSSTACSLRHA